ncbi:MAG: beta-xylosidase [Planctomycetes bacterium]|nr:beta-xylosidase [Planctomycetota bacterium]
MHAIDFHAHHSPLGAYASFTCGKFGAGGGLTIEGAKPATQDLVIGWIERDGTVRALPFYTGAVQDLSNFAAGGTSASKRQPLGDGLTRRMSGGSDTWSVGDLVFSIYTPVVPLPDPAVAGETALQEAILPVVTASLRLTNHGSEERHLVFGIGAGAACYRLGLTGGAQAVGWGRDFGIAALDQPGLQAWVNWNEQDWFEQRRDHLLGSSCGFVLPVPAGATRELQLVLGFCRQGPVTTGIEASYYYARAHPTVTSVLAAGAARYVALKRRAEEMDRELEASALDEHRRFLVAHAERSYWGNTQLLDRGGDPLWVVLEGEYAMINTFDLTVDMLFYELRRNPWTVRNVLDLFVERYGYVDHLARPAADAKRLSHEFTRDPKRLAATVSPPATTGLPGGLSFTHDMGVQGHFTPPGTSSYELSGLVGCFSYMTCEQLYNWVLCATGYVVASGDHAWLAARHPVLLACLQSALNRDDPEASRRTGVASLDSSRCEGGWEITTYDSLDPSLGQARNNLYMAVKGWAAHLGLSRLFELIGDAPRKADAEVAARRAAGTIVARFDPAIGYIPAVFEGGNVSAIIPAIEALVYPLEWKLDKALDRKGPYAELIETLGKHLAAVLVPGRCLFADGGWKLSSTSDNSWMSKIFICQHVAEQVFGIVAAPDSHAAHAHWQQVGSAEWAMCDQIIAGKAIGSRYYPRCVTADLWREKVRPAAGVRSPTEPGGVRAPSGSLRH